MTDSISLASLGWTGFFDDQLESDEKILVPTRIASVHRDRLAGLSQTGPADLTLPANANTGDYAVGDWVLVEPHTHLLRRRLTRKTVLERRTQGGRVPQLAAANVDTLFIVTSCNADFNIARLERYLALANEAGTTPVILLTKADTAEDAETYQSQAAALQRGLAVVTLNPRVADAATALADWCGAGQTVALVGSSGVGKSTLVNTLAGSAQQSPQQTAGIREHDAKGRHTTTARSLHAHRRRRLGDRHARDAHATRQRRRLRHRYAVCRNHRACPAVQVPRLHPRPRTGLRGASRLEGRVRSIPSVSPAGANCPRRTRATRRFKAGRAATNPPAVAASDAERLGHALRDCFEIRSGESYGGGFGVAKRQAQQTFGSVSNGSAENAARWPPV